ncbi:hypothetical protein BDV93DRAFT_514873 [Ceratobasidium sp. AG-I]|nr:hypothetical protein BDV93DRAFT_514873 [Ceratobasidium sp. AG-I]
MNLRMIRTCVQCLIKALIGRMQLRGYKESMNTFATARSHRLNQEVTEATGERKVPLTTTIVIAHTLMNKATSDRGTDSANDSSGGSMNGSSASDNGQSPSTAATNSDEPIPALAPVLEMSELLAVSLGIPVRGSTLASTTIRANHRSPIMSHAVEPGDCMVYYNTEGRPREHRMTLFSEGHGLYARCALGTASNGGREYNKANNSAGGAEVGSASSTNDADSEGSDDTENSEGTYNSHESGD